MDSQLEYWQRQALLTEYQVCQKDNSANFQGFWTLAAIFLGLSSAFLAGLIYAIIANDSLLGTLLSNNDSQKSLTLGAITLLVGIANVVILRQVRGWHMRIQFNQRELNRRMREIELQLGMMQRGWRIYGIDRWYEKLGDKEPAECSEEVWNKLKPKLEKGIDPKLVGKLDALRDDLVRLIKWYFPKQHRKDTNHKYETWSSGRHFPRILLTLMGLWGLAIVAALIITTMSVIRIVSNL